jgi:Fur family ferric uptake transcriptional regulator
LARRDLGSRRARYEPSGEKNHFHLVDQESGKVLEFSAPAAETLLRDIAARHGFDLAMIKIELFGRKASGASATDEGLSGTELESHTT